ncbi:MAG: type I DNA topoisomerase [Anaerolineae bacterium]|nr:type I DNA topoisomerase [Anaerolineae bacterium]
MAKKLLIVESPAKVKTIRGFLGEAFIVAASLGHIRDLPERELGIEPDSFRPHYAVLSGKSEVVRRLKGLVKGAAALYLATDPDREGEAIAWHLVEVLKPRCPVYRVTFNTITEAAVKAALQSPRRIDRALVNAQQARRIVDRLVGYEISPLLWGRFDGENLSAGRVQTVGLRLVVEREQEIQAFQPEAYWTLDADFEAREGTFTARLVSWHGADIALKDEGTTRAIMTALGAAHFSVQSIAHQEKARHPLPPFTTSTLQQAASSLLGFSPEKTMQLAQELYEGVDLSGRHLGLITYLRTDAVQVAQEAQSAAVNFIRAAFGDAYLPPKLPSYKAKQSAQEAHEAIRPTEVTRVPDEVKGALSDDLHALYALIWSRFVASQMAAATFAEALVIVESDDGAALFRAKGRTPLFDGFLRVYAHEEVKADTGDSPEESPLPELRQDEGLLLTGWSPVERFTRAPGRYTEASLIQALEKQSIGRPSTYASTLATLKARGYVEVGKGRKLLPTAQGAVICEFLTTQFIDIFAYDFTARLENDLDAIAEGRADWVAVLRRFWQTLQPQLQTFEVTASTSPMQPLVVGEVCPKCGQPLRQRTGKNGSFLGCSGYPDCRYTHPLDAVKPNRRSSPKRRKTG